MHVCPRGNAPNVWESGGYPSPVVVAMCELRLLPARDGTNPEFTDGACETATGRRGAMPSTPSVCNDPLLTTRARGKVATSSDVCALSTAGCRAEPSSSNTLDGNARHTVASPLWSARHPVECLNSNLHRALEFLESTQSRASVELSRKPNEHGPSRRAMSVRPISRGL